MLTDRQVERMLRKLQRLEKTLDPFLFDKVAEVTGFRAFETAESLYRIPADRNFKKIADGAHWGARGHYCWFKASFRVPKDLDGKMLFLRPQIGGYESLLWVNGEPFGTYSTKISFSGHGNHYSDLLVKKAK
ncbi:MAG: alpha-mannosidase, partial [Clostridia bacterium]|nr:alpha-mannosidase [Clostridia bacterium]